MTQTQTIRNVPCSAVTRSGQPCGMRTLRGGTFCFIHSPHTAAKRRASRRQGGLNSRVRNAPHPVSLADAADVRVLVAQAVADAQMHDNTLKRATVVLRGAEVALKVLDAMDLRQRLDALESRFEAMEAMNG